MGETQFDKQPLRFRIAGSAMVSFFLAQAAVFLTLGLRIRNIALSPTETVLQTPILLSNIANLLLLIILIVALLFRVFKVDRLNIRKIRLSWVVAYLISSFLSFGFYWLIEDTLKESRYSQFVSENRLLIDAIEKYTEEQGQPPHALINLYPAYYDWGATVDNSAPEGAKLDISIPYKSLDEESAKQVIYSYESSIDDISLQRPVSWELTLTIQRAPFPPVQLVYNPEEIYPTEGTIRVGFPHEWAILGDY